MIPCYNRFYLFSQMQEIHAKIKNSISWASKILLVSHRRPDADTVGSAVAMKVWLDSLAKQTTLACVDPIPENYSFMPFADQFVDEFRVGDYDLMIVLDAGASYMTDFHLKYPEMFKSGIEVINIDHHQSNDLFGTINYVDVDAPSVTFMLWRMFKDFDLEITAQMATALLAGIYNDTGSFMHSNTNEDVCRAASDLLACGANLRQITKNMFRSRDVSTLKLWGKVLEHAYITDDNVVMSVVREDDYQSANAKPDQLSGVIDYLNMVPESKFSVLINEDRKGNVKGSLRTRKDDVDLAKIAKVFGGGGHAKASGFTLTGKLRERFKYDVVSENLSKKSLDF